MTDSPHSELELFHLTVDGTGEALTLVRKEDYDGLLEQLETAHERLTELGVPTHDDAGGPINNLALRISVLADSFPAKEQAS